MLEEVETDQSRMAGQLSVMESSTYDTSRVSGIADISNRSFGVRSDLDESDALVCMLDHIQG